MKRLLKLLTFLGGLGAAGWLLRNRIVTVTMNREPKAPKLVPEPMPEELPQDDLTQIDGVGPDEAQILRAAGIATASQLADADAGALAVQTGMAEAQIASWIGHAVALK